MKENFYKPYLKFTEDHFQWMPRAFHVGKFSYAITVVLNYQLLWKSQNWNISDSHTMWLGKEIFNNLISRFLSFSCIPLWKEINLLKEKFSSQDVWATMTKLFSELQGRRYVHKDHVLFTRAANIKQTDMRNSKKCSLLLYIVPSSLSQGSFIITNHYQ